MKKNKGFNLIELMIVLAIVGIIASIAVPSFSRMIERNRLKGAVQSLQSDLQHARTLAIKQSRNIIVTRAVGNEGAWCYGFSDTGTACDCTQTTTTADDYCNVKRILGANVSSVTNITSFSANTTFSFRRGTANGSNTCFSTANYKAKVMASPAGRVSICSDTTAPLPGYENCENNCP